MKIKSVKFNFLMNLILTVSNVLFPLITFPYVARVLQPINNGKIAFCTSVISYFSMVALIGIPNYGIREVAKVRDDRDKLTKLVYELLLISLVMTIISITVLVISIFIIPKFYQEKELFFINAIGILLNTIGVNWLYSGLEQYQYITIRSIIFKVISIIAMFLFVKEPSDYILYGTITVLASGGSNIFNFFNMKKFINFRVKEKLEIKKHMKPILIFFATVLATSIYVNLDTVMIGFINGNVEVGLYSTSLKIRSLVLSVITALGTVLMPRLSYYINNNQKELFKETIVKCINFVSLISISICIFIVIYAKECILFIAGNDYLLAVSSLRIVIFTIIFVGFSNITGIQILTPLGLERKLFISIVYGAIIDFILNMFFIPLYKSNGAALATLIAEIIVLAVQCYYLKEFIREIYKKLTILKYVVFTLIASVIVILFKNYFTFNVFTSLLIGAFIYFGIGILLLIITKDPFIKMGFEFIKKKGN